MSTNTVAPTNGAAKKVNGTKTETITKATKPEEPQKQLPPVVPASVVIPMNAKTDGLPSLEDRFYKLDQLFALREKHEALKESLDKVNKFKLSADGRAESITLKDSYGNTFGTHNPEVLAKVVEWLKEDLTKKIKDVDNQIRL